MPPQESWGFGLGLLRPGCPPPPPPSPIPGWAGPERRGPQPFHAGAPPLTLCVIQREFLMLVLIPVKIWNDSVSLSLLLALSWFSLNCFSLRRPGVSPGFPGCDVWEKSLGFRVRHTWICTWTSQPRRVATRVGRAPVSSRVCGKCVGRSTLPSSYGCYESYI